MKAIAVTLALLTVTAAAAAVLADEPTPDAAPVVVNLSRVEAPRASAPAPVPDGARAVELRPVAAGSIPRAPQAAPITVPLRFFLAP